GSPEAPAAGLSPASPKARRLAAERGTRLEGIRGSGPGGAVLAADVSDLEPLVQGAPGPAAALETGRLWRLMAERTARSWSTAPHFYLARDVDAGRLLGWRAALVRQGLKVTLSDLLVRLVGATLAAHPRLNVRWEDGLVALEGVDVALAVATPEGLVAPVLRGVDRLDLEQIAARRAELVGRAREGRLTTDDVGRGGFTVSNLGMYGVDAFSAILNGGQAAILAVGRIADRVVAVSGSPQVRPVMTMTLSCDHRAVDGARGAEFLEALAGLVEEPAGLVR
ncbi:MAG: dihydrolipoamide acetyltransferase family protein, partial [Candidatus Dormibacterales bacterium]